MYYFYIDESGNSDTIINPTDNIQPLLAICGLIISAEYIKDFTKDFITCKRTFFPGKFNAIKHDLDALQIEIKGSDIRTEIRKNQQTSKIVQHHFKFLDAIFALLKKYEIKIVARIWVKGFGVPLKDKSVYTLTTQELCRRFQEHLTQLGCVGSIIADFRDPHRNSYVSHSIFTKKYKQNGDAYPSIFELPSFGISNNHACLQVADILCSTIISPMAGLKFCSKISNAHTHANYKWIATRYSRRLKALQFNFKVKDKIHWGITASNPHDPKNQNLFY